MASVTAEFSAAAPTAKAIEKGQKQMKKANLNDYLQVKKSTGETLTMKQPIYRCQELWEVYSKYSKNKAIAFEKCRQLLHDFTCDNYGKVLNRGIISASNFSFIFGAVFEIDGLKYVLRCSSDRHNNHYGNEENNTTDMIAKVYLLEAENDSKQSRF